MSVSRTFHGSGWAFPVRPGPGGGIARVEGDEAVRRSVLLIMATSLGERTMRPGFGTPVPDMVFDPAGPRTLGRARFYVRGALERFEPRIRVERVETHIDGLRLVIEVEYTVRRTNHRANLVYPFYLHGERQGVRS